MLPRLVTPDLLLSTAQPSDGAFQLAVEGVLDTTAPLLRDELTRLLDQ